MRFSRRHALSALAAVPLTLTATGTARAATGAPTGAPVPGGRPATTPVSDHPRYAVYLAGDSTASTKGAGAAPETGWGMALPLLLAEDVAVRNHAVNGRSSRSFYDEGLLDPILAEIGPGDLLLVQFGHNDEKTDDPDRGTDPYTTFQDYLRRYLDGARSRGARPVLLTPVERRRFDSAGSAQPTHGEYPAAMRALAAEEEVPLLDLQAASLTRWAELGPDGTLDVFLWLAAGEHPNYPDGVEDNTHLQPHGAIEVARLAARALGERGVVDAADVRRLDEDIPDSEITWP